jgi:hypothetical protein
MMMPNVTQRATFFEDEIASQGFDSQGTNQRISDESDSLCDEIS